VTLPTVEFAGLPGVPPERSNPRGASSPAASSRSPTLCEVRDRAASILRGMGFLAAVQVPPQRIEANGAVRMDVLARQAGRSAAARRRGPASG
jgi:hypothetical protein